MVAYGLFCFSLKSCKVGNASKSVFSHQLNNSYHSNSRSYVHRVNIVAINEWIETGCWRHLVTGCGRFAPAARHLWRSGYAGRAAWPTSRLRLLLRVWGSLIRPVLSDHTLSTEQAETCIRAGTGTWMANKMRTIRLTLVIGKSICQFKFA